MPCDNKGRGRPYAPAKMGGYDTDHKRAGEEITDDCVG